MVPLSCFHSLASFYEVLRLAWDTIMTLRVHAAASLANKMTSKIMVVLLGKQNPLYCVCFTVKIYRVFSYLKLD